MALSPPCYRTTVRVIEHGTRRVQVAQPGELVALDSPLVVVDRAEGEAGVVTGVEELQHLRQSEGRVVHRSVALGVHQQHQSTAHRGGVAAQHLIGLAVWVAQLGVKAARPVCIIAKHLLALQHLDAALHDSVLALCGGGGGGGSGCGTERNVARDANHNNDNAKEKTMSLKDELQSGNALHRALGKLGLRWRAFCSGVRPGVGGAVEWARS
jgi:hypothetical protein